VDTLQTQTATTAQLADLGLTSYQARTYLALLRRDSSTAAQAARLANLPRQRIYDVLASLVDKGLASTRPGRVVEYAAVAPGLAFERILSDQRQQLADLERHTVDLIAKLTPAFDAGHEQDHPLEYIEVLHDRRAINERFEELQAAVQREILVLTKGLYATPRKTRAEQARSVYEFSVFEDPDQRRLVATGEQARFVRELPLELVIIDESIVMFAMEDPVAGGGEATIVVVEHPSLARTLTSAFTAIWEQALTFDQARAASYVALRSS